MIQRGYDKLQAACMVTYIYTHDEKGRWRTDITVKASMHAVLSESSTKKKVDFHYSMLAKSRNMISLVIKGLYAVQITHSMGFSNWGYCCLPPRSSLRGPPSIPRPP